MAAVLALPPPLESAEAVLHGGLSPQSWLGRIVPRISPSCLGEGGVSPSFRKSTVPQSMPLLVKCLPSSSPESALQHSLPVSKGDHVYLQILGPNGKSLPSIAQTSTSNL